MLTEIKSITMQMNNRLRNQGMALESGGRTGRSQTAPSCLKPDTNLCRLVYTHKVRILSFHSLKKSFKSVVKLPSYRCVTKMTFYRLWPQEWLQCIWSCTQFIEKYWDAMQYMTFDDPLCYTFYMPFRQLCPSYSLIPHLPYFLTTIFTKICHFKSYIFNSTRNAGELRGNR